jgi:hypothetical protein
VVEGQGRLAAAFGPDRVAGGCRERLGSLPDKAERRAVCNLYSLTKGQAAIREIARAMRDTTGNLPPLPGIFPDQLAPVVRTARDGARELATMRWGFPPVAQPGARPITNVRNLGSGYWRGWLKPEFRCLVPATSFCEYDGRHGKRPTWFALGEDRPLFASSLSLMCLRPNDLLRHLPQCQPRLLAADRGAARVRRGEWGGAGCNRAQRREGVQRCVQLPTSWAIIARSFGCRNRSGV